MNLRRCTSNILDTSVPAYGCRRGLCSPRRRPIRYDLAVGCHFVVTQGQGTILRSSFPPRSSAWPLSSPWKPYAHLALVFELWVHPPSDLVLTPANWQTRRGRERLIPSRTGPKKLSTVASVLSPLPLSLSSINIYLDNSLSLFLWPPVTMVTTLIR